LDSKKAKFDQIDNEIEKEWYDEKFNEWLDQDVDRILDIEKNKEVKDNTEDVSDKLKALNFEIELSALQEEIQQQKESTKKEDILTI
jgi:hypothetical protein